MIFAILLASVVAFAIYFYFSVKEKHRYFEKLGIPFVKPVFLVGNGWTTFLGRESMSAFLNRMYLECPGERLVGVFHGTAPVVIVKDPDFVGAVLSKDFTDFHDRGIVIDEELNPLEGHLFNLSGSKWKILRSKLTPTFSTGKIKSMLALMDKCVDAFVQDIDANLGKEIDVKNEFLRLASHVIGSCTFGIETDTVKNETSDFTRLGVKIIQPDTKEMILTILRFFSPALARRFKFRTIPKEVNDFFFGLVKETMDYRKSTGYSRNDFLQLLLELREKGEIQMTSESGKADSESSELKTESHEKLVLTDGVLTAQAAVFLAAGFETTSTSLAFVFYELSKNLEVQEKLRSEVHSMKNKYNGFTYDALKGMHFMDAVINETLRLWPPVGGLIRVCTKTTTLGPYTIEKGVIIQLPTEGLQKNAAFYPDPLVFKPERFVEDAVPNYTFLPFGGGPRACIGERFARLEMKIAIAKILDRYKINTCPKMAAVEPIKYKVNSFINVPNDGIFCIMSKLN